MSKIELMTTTAKSTLAGLQERVRSVVCATPKGSTPAPKGAPEPAAPVKPKRKPRTPVVRTEADVDREARKGTPASTKDALAKLAATARAKLPGTPPAGLSEAETAAWAVKPHFEALAICHPAPAPAPAPVPGEEDKDLPAFLDRSKNGVKPTKAPPAAPATAAKPASKPAAKPAGRRTGYDWTAAEKLAKDGKVPPLPPFKSYDVHIKDAHEMAKKGDAKAIETYVADFAGYGAWRANAETDKVPTSRRNFFRFAHLCLTALKAKAKAKA